MGDQAQMAHDGAFASEDNESVIEDPLEVIDSSDEMSDEEDDDCPICLDPLINPQVTTLCGHHFHEDCLRTLVQSSTNCPCCRTSKC